MVEASWILAALSGVIGGTWVFVAVRSSVKRAARRSDGDVRVLRAGMVWWGTGVVFGIVAPILFLVLHLSNRPPDGGGTVGVLIIAGVFALGGGGALVHAVGYRLTFGADAIEYRSPFRRRRALRWADVTSVSWLPIRSQLLLRGAAGEPEIHVSMESGFLDFVAALEEHVPREILGDAAEKARRAAA